MVTAILGIVNSLLKFAAGIFGDALIAKWLGALKFWWRQQLDPKIKAAADTQYEQILKDWDVLKNERQNIKPK